MDVHLVQERAEREEREPVDIGLGKAPYLQQRYYKTAQITLALDC